ncbi:MAG: hypothetical protein N2Z60_08900, partial [Elusimicrobiales bacterium]|nr:hypothetical protein [Elusimicrobiales bacterium]
MVFKFLIFLFAFNSLIFASVDDSMYELKKDLKSKMFNKTDKKILKIAVLNFKDIGEDAAKSKAGEIVSSA